MLSLTLALILPAHAGRADRNAERAYEAYTDMDTRKALKHCSKALRIDPSHVDASAVCGGALLQVGTQAQDPELIQLGVGLLDYVASVDPNHPLVGTWEAMLTMWSSPVLIPEPEVRCTPAAQGAWNKAEEAFSRGDMKEAREYYEVAANSCEHPQLWTYYSDTFFHEGDLEGAIAAYDHALEIEPCYWAARRFKGDALFKNGRQEEGIRWTASAIACNPTYETAWSYLAGGMDPRVSRARGPGKPTFGDDAIDLTLQTSGPWPLHIQVIYGGALAAELPSRLDRERYAVGMVLDTMEGRPGEGMELWQLLGEAEARGQLDPAIFVLLLDEALVPEFLDYREEHLDELTDFVLSLMR